MVVLRGTIFWKWDDCLCFDFETLTFVEETCKISTAEIEMSEFDPAIVTTILVR